jgi:hypothetical protein
MNSRPFINPGGGAAVYFGSRGSSSAPATFEPPLESTCAWRCTRETQATWHRPGSRCSRPLSWRPGHKEALPSRRLAGLRAQGSGLRAQSTGVPGAGLHLRSTGGRRGWQQLLEEISQQLS